MMRRYLIVLLMGMPLLGASFGSLPLSFEPGRRPDQFLSRGKGYTLVLEPTEAVLAFPRTNATLRMKLAASNPAPVMRGLAELPGKSNYFIGNDPSKWRTNVPTYARVEYRDVYPGVNLVYYGNQRNLEYDLVVAPGADPGKIHLAFEGAAGLELNGDLVLRMNDGELRLRRPVIYQEKGGRRQEIRGGYVLEGEQQVGFQIAKYDHGRPLYIDPVLSYATYLGGSGDDLGYGIAVDSAGNSYIVGSTTSTNFPTASAFQSSNAGGQDVFVTKLNPTGTSALYSTYIGGGGNDYGYGIAVDTGGNAYLIGQTASTNFPTLGALQSTNGGGADAFVLKLGPTGSSLVYSTYLGGNGSEEGRGIAVDPSGNAYVTGQTSSSNFPTASAFQPAFGGGTSDAFVAKINPAGSAFIYSTYLGGIGTEVGYGVAVDASANAIVTGLTSSASFPTVVPSQAALGGGVDAFVTKFNTAGSALVYSTFLGGSATDQASAVAIDAAGNAYVTGFTASTNFPTSSPLQAANAGGEDAFVTKFSPAGALSYSTYLGGGGNDRGYGIALENLANAFVTG